MFAVLGSGFGLYGYIPALVDGCAEHVVLPERYRARFSERPELSRFADAVRWEPDDHSALERADGVVLARRPVDQSEWLPRCLAQPNLDRLILEKPLAPSPEAAEALHDRVVRSGKTFRMAYTFRHTDWGEQLLRTTRPAGESGSLSIDWAFQAHHYEHDLRNWKRSHIAGGGAIRFYGIHVIALLAELGYRDVLESRSGGASPDEVERWNAAFGGSGLPRCEIALDTRANVSRFRVEWRRAGTAAALASLDDPFDHVSAGRERVGDRRVLALGRLCRSLGDDGATERALYDTYGAVLRLWAAVEERTGAGTGPAS